MKENNTVAVVLTSCGRFDLLAKTLESFFRCNTYPLTQFILVEDSGMASLEDVKKCIPVGFEDTISIIINEANFGQVVAVDRAYQKVSTKYVFHCEDDWLFYRSGFIEESIKILETDDKIFSVWLRSYYNDILHYAGGYDIFFGDKLVLNCSTYSRIFSKRNNNQCFSFNPSLRQHRHYPKQGYSSLSLEGKGIEDVASSFYEANGMYSVLLENSAVNHLGFGRQVKSNKHKQKSKRNKLLALLIVFTSFFIGFLIGTINE